MPSLPRVVLRLHSKNWVLDVLGAVLGKHALPDIAGGFVRGDTVLVDPSGGVLNRVGPLQAAVVVARHSVAEHVGRWRVAGGVRVLEVLRDVSISELHVNINEASCY